MAMSSQHHDYITNSVAGKLTLLIIAAGLVMAVALFYLF